MHVSLLDTDSIPPPRKSLVMSAVVGVVVLVCILDRLTAPYYSFTPLYLLPLAAAAWLSGWRAAFVIAVLAAFAHFGSRLWTYGLGASWAPLAWDALSLLAMFVLFVWFVLWLHRTIAGVIRDARIDTVTGLARRGVFQERGRWELARAARYARALTVVYIDIDRFKAVNDEFGHEAGDRVLGAVGALLQKGVRTFDLAARLGGDEFGLLLPETNETEAGVLLKRLCAKLREAARPDGSVLTFSIGAVTTVNASDDSFDTLLAHADALMYDVKNSTRNGLRQKTLVGTGTSRPKSPGRMTPGDAPGFAPSLAQK
jgi:diguanylate cyclase (GGDEF)-like protein